MPNSAVTANANAPIARAAGTAGTMIDHITGITNANNAWSAQQAAEQRKWQEEQTQWVMDYNSAEAAKNRDWQEMMSNTAHQREIKDLQAAGLNPVLSATGGQGASVGSGASASASAPSGAKGDTDTSGASALVGMMSSLINAQVQLANANLSAVTNLETTNRNNETSKEIAKLQTDTQLTTANISAMASKYAADTGAETSRVVASIQAAAAKYGYDVSAMTQKEIAAFNAQVNKDLQAAGFQHDFDLKEAYPDKITGVVASLVGQLTGNNGLSGSAQSVYDFIRGLLPPSIRNNLPKSVNSGFSSNPGSFGSGHGAGRNP